MSAGKAREVFPRDAIQPTDDERTKMNQIKAKTLKDLGQAYIGSGLIKKNK